MGTKVVKDLVYSYIAQLFKNFLKMVDKILFKLYNITII